MILDYYVNSRIARDKYSYFELVFHFPSGHRQPLLTWPWCDDHCRCEHIRQRHAVAPSPVVFAHPEALALTEQRMRGECADVVDLGRVPLDPMAPHGPYHVLRQPCCLLLWRWGGAGGDAVDSGSALYPTALPAPSFVAGL